jgi:hypothetical protein
MRDWERTGSVTIAAIGITQASKYGQRWSSRSKHRFNPLTCVTLSALSIRIPSQPLSTMAAHSAFAI